MKWKILFSVGDKTYKTKLNIFEDIQSALNYSNEMCKKYVMKNAKKITSKIISQNKEELHHIVYYINGETEYFIKMLKNNTYIPVKMSSKDYQKNVVYAWEERAFKKVGFFNSDFTVYKARKFISKIIENEGLSDLELNFIEGYGDCYFKYTIDNSMNPSLNISKEWGLNKLVISHEMAHYAIYEMGLKEDPHGKNFIGVYIYLLSKYTGLKEEKLWSSAITCGVQLNKYSKNEVKKLIID
jgi:hypothetical protein